MIQTESTSYSLRPATEDDLKSVLAIEAMAYPEPTCRPWTEQAFREELQKPFSNFLVLTDDETDTQVIAYIIYWVMFEECHVLNISVHPEWRGLGHALFLMRHVVSVGLRKELKRIFLEVRKSNAGAVALYQKLGFFIDHIKPAFYENGDDAYFMVLYLEQKNTF